MTQKLDPKIYGLPPRTVLQKEGAGKISIVMNRKSRIIMKDARLILEKADKIREKEPENSISLETTAPVCSKSIDFLNSNGIDVIVNTPGE